MENIPGFEEGLGVINQKLDIDNVVSPPLIPSRFSSMKQWRAEGKESNTYSQTFFFNLV